MERMVWKVMIVLLILKALMLTTGADLAPTLPDFPDRYSSYPQKLLIEVNIPEGALYLYQMYNDRQFLLKKYPCSVGMMEFKTPEGNYLASTFSWNPGWLPPKSKWAENKEPIEPGMGSPLGVGALNVSFEQAILIHGTDQVQNLGKPASHGCIRLSNHNVTELLSYIQDNVPKSQGKSNVQSYRENPSTKVTIDLYRTVAVKLVYRRTALDTKALLPDVYQKGFDPTCKLDKATILTNNANLKNIISDLSQKVDEKAVVLAQDDLAFRPYPYTGNKQKPIRRYYASTKMRFYVWSINHMGQTTSAWNRLATRS